VTTLTARLTTTGRVKTRVLGRFEQRGLPGELVRANVYAEYGMRNDDKDHWLLKVVVLRAGGSEEVVQILGPDSTLPAGGYPRTIWTGPVQLPRDLAWLAVKAVPVGQPTDLDDLHVMLEIRPARSPRGERRPE